MKKYTRRPRNTKKEIIHKITIKHLLRTLRRDTNLSKLEKTALYLARVA